MPMFSEALQSGAILLREGLEALLVITALAALLHKAGLPEKIRLLYAGAAAAILASIVAAVIFELFFSGAHDDRVEAAVMAIAAALMFYMSGWMVLRQNPQAWRNELHRAAHRAIGAGATASLAAVAFLAVFREGAETILFLYALGKSFNGYTAGFWLGLAAAACGLIALFVALRLFALRLPLRPLFIATSAFLFVMGLRFVGAIVQELQELAYVDVTPLDMPQWLIGLGVNPSLEAVGAQAAAGLLALASTALALFRTRQQAAAMAAA